MIEFRCSEQMKFYRRGSREVWSTKKLPVPRDQGSAAASRLGRQVNA